jgi:hypothetical protein
MLRRFEQGIGRRRLLTWVQAVGPAAYLAADHTSSAPVAELFSRQRLAAWREGAKP